MTTELLYLIGWNQCVAVILGLSIWLACRTRMLRERPALGHGLWLLVLLKLVTPSIIPVPVLPTIAAREEHETATLSKPEEIAGSVRDVFALAGGDARAIAAAPIAVDSAEIAAADVAPSPAGVASSAGGLRLNGRATVFALLGISLFVSFALWLAAIRQLRQVRRLLQGGSVSLGRTAELLQDVWQRFDLQSPASLVIVDAPITPMLWAASGNAAIVLPRQLADSLGDDPLRLIIAHELAHFVRRDHWANSFAFIVATLFWWNPIAWFARRELATAAETSCDSLALQRLAGSRKSYAETLLAVVDYVSTAKPLRPAVGIAFGESHSLRRRFEMLAISNVKSTVSRVGWLLLALGCLTLMLVPARAQQRSTKEASPSSVATEGEKAAKDDDPAAKPAESAPQYSVTGRVFEQTTGGPIAGAQIRILVESEQEPEKRLLLATSDANGRYRIAVPLGSVRLWLGRLAPGYWSSDDSAITSLVTSPDKPIATHDIPLTAGPAWPVRLVVEGGKPDLAGVQISVTEVDDDATRQAMLRGENVSFTKPTRDWLSTLAADGTGAFTQCGDTGKLILRFGGEAIRGVTTELIVEPRFDVTKIKSIEPVAGTDKVAIIDQAGATATIRGAEVTLPAGRPLLTFHAQRRPPPPVQEFAGRIVDTAGNPVEGVRIGSTFTSSHGSGGSSEGSTTTDKQGRFILKERIFDGDSNDFLAFVITKDGYAAFDSRRIPFPKQASKVIDVGKFILQPGQSLPIRVVDEDDKPLAGAVVEPGNAYALRRQAIRTDADGRGLLRNLPSGPLRVSASYGDKYKQTGLVVSPLAAKNVETMIYLDFPATPPAATAKTPEPPEPLAVGQAAPEWFLAGWTDGQQRKLSDYRGKLVVLDFWATWCGSCVAAIPVMEQLAKKYEKQGVVFLGIHPADGQIEQIKKLQELKGWTAPTAIDVEPSGTGGETIRRYGVRGYSTIMLIAADGKIAFNGAGQDSKAMIAELEKLAGPLGVPWPPEKWGEGEEAVKQFNKLIFALFSAEIDKALAAALPIDK